MTADHPTQAQRCRCVCSWFWPLLSRPAQVRLMGWLVLCLGLLSQTSCLKREQQPTTSATPTSNAPTKGGQNSKIPDLGKSDSYNVVDVPNPGTLEVEAVFVPAPGDPIPKQVEVNVNINADVCGHKVFTENLIVDPATKALKNVVVRLEGIMAGSRRPPETVEVTNKNCSFVPHVTVAMKGTKFQVRNDDPVQHTTHPFVNDIHFFNIVLSAGAEPPRPRTLRQTGLMQTKCDVHAWMNAYTVIHKNPYIEVSDERGQLTIDQIPPGEYDYLAWHETLPEARGKVKITGGETRKLRLEFKLAQ